MTEGDDRLRQFLNDGRNWERKATNIAGVLCSDYPILEEVKDHHFRSAIQKQGQWLTL